MSEDCIHANSAVGYRYRMHDIAVYIVCLKVKADELARAITARGYSSFALLHNTVG